MKKNIYFPIFLLLLCCMSLYTNAQYVPPTHVDGAAPNGILWDTVLTGRTLPVRTGVNQTGAVNGQPGAVMFYDKATGKIGINPNGLSLNAVIVTYTSGNVNINAASPGPFIYSGNTSTNSWSPSIGTPKTFPAIQVLTGLPPTTFSSRFGTNIGPPLSPSLATTGDANNIASTDGFLNRPWSFGSVVNIDSLIANNKVLADSNFKVIGQNSNANANLLGYGPVGSFSQAKGVFQYGINGAAGTQVGPIVFYSSAPSCTAPTLSSSITHQSCSNLNDGAIDLTATGGSPAPTFAWSGPNSFTSTSEDISNLAPGQYTVTASSGTCTATATYTVNAGSSTQAASVSIASNATANTICAGTSVTFTATPTNGGASPSYQWKLNGNSVGSNSSTYTTTSLANNDIVSVVMISNASCVTGSPATSNSITTIVNGNQAASVSIASNATGNTICAGTSVTFTATANLTSRFVIPNQIAPPFSFQWKLNGNNVGSNSTTYTTTSLTNNDVVSVVATSSATCVVGSPATSNSITTTVNANQAASVSIASNATANTICAGTSVTFTATPTNGGASPSYQWKRNGNNVGSNSSTYTTTSLANNDIVSVVMISNASCVTGSPAVSGNITTSVNQPSSSSETITAIGSYQWNGQSYSTSGTYTWTGVNSVGCDSTASLILTINAVVINNISNVCNYIGTQQTLTYTASVAGASSYTWTLPANTQLISGQGTRSIEIKLLNGFATQDNKQIRVTPAGGSLQVIYLLAQSPVTPSTIVASSANICTILGTSVPVNFTIPKVGELASNVATATSYIWTAQNGTTTITHPNGNGVNDTTVAISFASNFTTSNITVQSVNACGVSSTRSYLVTTNAPTQPSLISGAINTCEFIGASGQLATYSVRADANVINYAWTLPQGATNVSGQGSRTISFRYPASYTGGTISVTSTNGCGTSPSRSLTVSRLLPVTPGNIDVINTQSCPNRVYTYSIASLPFNATSLLWSIPDGATLVSGQGSTSITVSYPSGVIDGYVTVKSVSNCAFSTTRNAQVRMAPCPVNPSPGFTKGSMTTTPSTMDVKVFPNPTTSSFNLQVTAGGSKSAIQTRVLDLQGRLMKTITIQSNENISLGAELKPGVYMLEVLQGVEKKVVRMVKY